MSDDAARSEPKDEKPKATFVNATKSRLGESSFTPTDEGGFVEKGDGYLIMGMGGPETNPPPMPPKEELRKAAEHPHGYPDLVQPPGREQFADDAAFNKALIYWMVNVGPAVVRRDRQRAKGRPSAKDIIAAARASQKASDNAPPPQS